MKLTKVVVFISLISSFSSCSDWLDVEPKTEIKSDIMFESESGFKDAIIGCYILMSNSSLYGKELTSGFMDVIAWNRVRAMQRSRIMNMIRPSRL